MRYKTAGFASILLLGGCTMNGIPAATTGAAPSTFATELAGQRTQLAPLPTAVVVLSDTDLNRNRAFCEAFLRLPTVAQA